MIRASSLFPLAVWAARDIQRQAGHHTLLFTCLLALVFPMTTILLFTQALDFTWARLMDQAPDLVVRRVDKGGWAPLPAEAAVKCARTVAGVLDPTPRLWGVATGPDGPVTVVTSGNAVPAGTLEGIPPPATGQAVVGQGVLQAATGTRLILGSPASMTVEIVATFPTATGLATHDLVWLSPEDARHLLGLTAGQASDLAVHLFRREEAQAIQADLAAAFPWPVRITGRGAGALAHHTRSFRTGGLAVVAWIPALLALLLVIAGITLGGPDRQARWGLLKSMGWTVGDILRLQVFKALIVGLPAVLLGLAAAYAMVFYPPAAGITALWITGGQHLPALTLNSGGAILVMLEMVVMVGLPCLAAVFLSSLRDAVGDSRLLVQAGPWN